MKPETIGRVLGVGLRVAGRMAGQRLAGSQTTASGPRPGAPTGRGQVAQPVTIDGITGRVAGRAAAQATGSVARGVGGFFKPFRRVGNIVFLEVAGVFFFIFVLVFGNWAWRLRDQAAQGSEHAKFLVCVGMMLVFLYLSVSSFWRARRK